MYMQVAPEGRGIRVYMQVAPEGGESALEVEVHVDRHDLRAGWCVWGRGERREVERCGES